MSRRTFAGIMLCDTSAAITCDFKKLDQALSQCRSQGTAAPLSPRFGGLLLACLPLCSSSGIAVDRWQFRRPARP